jgi:hypothetical protein
MLAPHKLNYQMADLPDELHQQLVDRPPKIMLHPGPAFGKHVGEPNKKVEGILTAVARAQEGERNRLLFWAACRISDMVANREIGAAEGAKSFQALNVVSINAGLPPREVARTIRSAVQ